MKKILGCILVLLMFAGTVQADGNRLGAQFSSGGDIGLIYYGNDFGWAVGGSIGFMQGEGKLTNPDRTELTDAQIEDGENRNDLEWDTDSLEFSVFARKNFKLMEKTHLGLGVTSSWGFKDVPLLVDNDEVDAKVWSIAPYFIVDYHFNNNFIINAGANIAEFKTTRYNYYDNYVGQKESVSYMEPFMSLTYLF